MHLFFIITTGLFGLIIGSFLNVVILRMNTGKGLGGRSQCFSCNTTLSWYELVPVLSYLVQKGRCRHCHSRIAKQYPIVEMVTGLLFASIAAQAFSLGNTILWLVWAALAVVIAVYDYHHHMIPVRPLIGLAVVSLFLGGYIIAAVVVALPFALLWFISLGRWIGFGDVEIIATIGLALGMMQGFSSVILAFWIACAVMIPWVLIMKYRHKKYNPQIPFGPFLLVGMYLGGVWGISSITFITNMIH